MAAAPPRHACQLAYDVFGLSVVVARNSGLLDEDYIDRIMSISGQTCVLFPRLPSIHRMIRIGLSRSNEWGRSLKVQRKRSFSRNCGQVLGPRMNANAARKTRHSALGNQPLLKASAGCQNCLSWLERQPLANQTRRAYRSRINHSLGFPGTSGEDVREESTWQ